MIHSAVHAARPDINAVAHSHSIHGRAFATLGRNLDITTQDSCAFYNDIALYDNFGGIVLGPEEGITISKALGQKKAAILANHGLLTCGTTIESCVFWFTSLEKCCRAQLMADAAAAGRGGETVKVSDEEAEFTYRTVGTENAVCRKGGFNSAPRGGGSTQQHRSYAEIRKENDRLEKYYDAVIPLDDAEREEFWGALKRELPNSFRFCGSKGHALAVKRLLEKRYTPEIVKIERFDGQPVNAPQPVPWYPDELAYFMNTPKQVIRKFPPFAAFQKFLVSETSVGNISRQEVVSMIPPLLMDVSPGMTVLDLCAAPGSKAAQLLEMVHVGEEARMRKFMESFGEAGPQPAVEEDVDLAVDAGDDGRATGLLIANDADYKRSHMLVHQLKRLSSPNLIVTNHDATLYPAIRLPRDPQQPDKGQYLRFDRILADVPCSGDGTLRKNINLWKDWLPGNALGLHLTQTRILVRALQMLKVGGRVVYSTCSMNPVENEAVIVSAIERCGGPDKIEIIDCKDRLPQLKRRPGLHQWQIMDKTGRIWSSWEEVQQHALTNDGHIPGKVLDTMFARPDTNECSGLPLDRCMRVYAHQQDTGGFFITVLEKKDDFKAKPEVSSKLRTSEDVTVANSSKQEDTETQIQIEEEKAALGEPTDVLPHIGAKRTLDEEEAETKPDTKKQRTESPPSEKVEANLEAAPEPQHGAPDPKEEEVKPETESKNNAQPDRRVKAPDGNYEEPFKYLPPDHPVIQSIQSFYKVSPRFPSDRFMVRNAMGEPAKAVYYTSALLRDILVENEGRGVKFVHGGVKMFMKQEAPSAEVCRWRIQSEGMPIIGGYVGPERVIHLTNKETFRTLLKEMFPKFIDEDWRKLNEIGERAREIGMGCCLLSIEPDGSDPDFSEHMVLPLWKSFHSLNLMLPKEDRSAMLLRVFNDTSPVINQTLKNTAKKEAEATDPETKEEIMEDVAAVEDADAQNGAVDPEAKEVVTEETEKADASIEANGAPDLKEAGAIGESEAGTGTAAT
ncbi:S-adenosyl-L-methionine-dependent methyltransferase [Whalleya microplaca]|nr:S-adenosyl-L-methionine-dependent methyltransferase [Whalleya microplaca]